ncbi:MAG: hypothetical protein XXXJIFNMEKO3_00214 [Candidatus Erwinia impunctatus]|nr:hypothetical protein XXXJIFNMEKO_00214 [Culicoides impunctatus]
MENKESINLMKQSGFSQREIIRIKAMSKVTKKSIEDVILRLSELHFQIIFGHALMIFIMLFLFLICYKQEGFWIIIPLAIAYVFCNMWARRNGPLILSFKSRRLVKVIRKMPH